MELLTVEHFHALAKLLGAQYVLLTAILIMLIFIWGELRKLNKQGQEGEEVNPYLLSGDELKRTEEARKKGQSHA